MDRIMKGVMRYLKQVKPGLADEFHIVKDMPCPRSIFFTCMDSRMLPTRFTQTHVGDMFVVRNAGNMIPHSSLCSLDSCPAEAAALEFSCTMNQTNHIIVCGHSDCKAMNFVYHMHKLDQTEKLSVNMSPLRIWLQRHAKASWEKFEKLDARGFDTSLNFVGDNPSSNFVAYIDPENKFEFVDKLSQVNTLQQLQNIASYQFLRPKLKERKLHMHALWFDIYEGDVYYFSRKAKSFVMVSTDTYENLLTEILSC